MIITHRAQSGHPGGSLSEADILAALYFYKLRINPKNPDWEDRDRFVLSKGHASPGYYAALAMKGYFPNTNVIDGNRAPDEVHQEIKKIVNGI